MACSPCFYSTGQPFLSNFSGPGQQAYTLREQLTAIFEETPFKNDAKRALRAWEAQVHKSGLNCFDGFLKTLHRYWEPITNYFVELLVFDHRNGCHLITKVASD
jgi:hypothetical protein